MKVSADERNKKVEMLLSDFIKKAEAKKNIEYPKPFNLEEVEKLFLSHIWGHREITLTILMARLIDPSFKASKDFYSCNPRSLYEKPIRSLLRKYNIPHKKSGPLNVAKNIQKIDEDWAKNKRGDGMALVVAQLVKKIETVSNVVLQKFILAYVQRYIQEAKKVAKLKFKIKKIQDPLYLFTLCRDLIMVVPDGGSSPQIITGLLLEHSNLSNHNKIQISGYKDSVSTTNTTSKKPGDLIELLSNGIKRVYEVTVKEFSIDRLIESYESIKAYDKSNKITEVFVICRKKDVPLSFVTNDNESTFLVGFTKNQDIVYYFVDIFEWIQEKLIFMPIEGRGNFYSDLVNYINDINTSEKVKTYFKEWHAAKSIL